MDRRHGNILQGDTHAGDERTQVLCVSSSSLLEIGRSSTNDMLLRPLPLAVKIGGGGTSLVHVLLMMMLMLMLMMLRGERS